MVALLGVDVEGYSRSATACEDERAGTDVSDVRLGTVVEVVEEAMEVWSRVHQP
jgi:hypothetical protein